MKSSGFNLKAISILVSILWYLNIALIVIGLPMLVIYFFNDNIFRLLVSVEFRTTRILEGISIKKVPATVELPLNATVIAYICLGVAIIESNLTIILYNLRRIFKAIKHGQPFHSAVVKSLRIIGMLISSWYLFGLLYDLILPDLLNTYQPDFFQKFAIEKQRNFNWVIAGAVIYILADIFRYGAYLKQETEEFV